MSTLPRIAPQHSDPAELHAGDRMTREEFHSAYERTPRHFKAELIGGTVYVASPLRRLHGTIHAMLNNLLSLYRGNTPGTEVGDNTTIILGTDSEPQPDLYLRILPDRGGQSKTDEDDYVVGPPELIVEVAHSSRAIDLYAKREDYARYGVREYLVASLSEKRMHWLHLPDGREQLPDSDGIVRVHCFPGLRIHVDALFADDFPRLMSVLQQGIDSPEHAAFVDQLRQAASR